jgi:hypothetical protein
MRVTRKRGRESSSGLSSFSKARNLEEKGTTNKEENVVI